jgi:hypothetical protein
MVISEFGISISDLKINLNSINKNNFEIEHSKSDIKKHESIHKNGTIIRTKE